MNGATPCSHLRHSAPRPLCSVLSATLQAAIRINWEWVAASVPIPLRDELRLPDNSVYGAGLSRAWKEGAEKSGSLEAVGIRAISDRGVESRKLRPNSKEVSACTSYLVPCFHEREIGGHPAM